MSGRGAAPGAIPGAIPWLNGLRVVRAVMVLDLAGWAWLLLRPGFSFASNPAYVLLASWGSPEHWAAAFILAVLFACTTGRVAWAWLHAGSAAVCAFMQAALAVSFTLGPHITTGAPTHLAIALAGAWLVWREMPA